MGQSNLNHETPLSTISALEAKPSGLAPGLFQCFSCEQGVLYFFHMKITLQSKGLGLDLDFSLYNKTF